MTQVENIRRGLRNQPEVPQGLEAEKIVEEHFYLDQMLKEFVMCLEKLLLLIHRTVRTNQQQMGQGMIDVLKTALGRSRLLELEKGLVLHSQKKQGIIGKITRLLQDGIGIGDESGQR